MTTSSPPHAPREGLWAAYARLAYRLRWIIVVTWIALCGLALAFPPPSLGVEGNAAE